MKYNRRQILWTSLAASVFSLAAAFVAQYGLGLKPCELCIAQRVPYALVIVVALLGLRFVRSQKYMLLLIALLFLVDGGIAAYHSLVEKHWVSGPSACTDSAGGQPQSIDDLLKKIEAAPVVACDQPQWEFHGITLAVMNAVWALALACTSLIMWNKIRT